MGYNRARGVTLESIEVIRSYSRYFSPLRSRFPHSVDVEKLSPKLLANAIPRLEASWQVQPEVCKTFFSSKDNAKES